MAKTQQPPPRKTVKARGALPAPRVAPSRDTTPWHAKTPTRVVMALVALALIGFIVKAVMDARDRADDRRADVRSVEQFERKVADLNTKVESVYQGLAEIPGAYLAGEVSQEEYVAQAEGWVTSFRELNDGIRNSAVSPDLEVLMDAKALYVQATTLYLDAAKVFLQAAAIPDAAEKEKATVLARNLFLHGASVYNMGDREMARLKNDFEINDPPLDIPAADLPLEEVQLPEPPPAPPASTDVEPGADVDPAAEAPAPAGPEAPAPTP